MKAYFVIRDFFEDCKRSKTAGIVMKSYKIDGIETITNEFFIENNVAGVAIFDGAFEYCKQTDLQGTTFIASSLENANSFNPFVNSMKLKFPEITEDIHRGKSLGSVSGQQYGEGLSNIWVDKSIIFNALNQEVKGAFALDIDFTKSLYVEFEILSTYFEGQLYANPIFYRRYFIKWNPMQCYREFSYLSLLNNQTYKDDGMGFLSGSVRQSENNYLDFSAIPCGQTDNPCEDKERTRSFAMFAKIPKADNPRPSLKECCYSARVFATLENNDYEKNDFTGLYHTKQLSNEVVEFILINVSNAEETLLNNNNLGTFKAFGSIEDNANLSTFVLDWKAVLTEYGEGTYTLLKRITIAGQEIEQGNINYTLQAYSTERADKTVRIDAYTSGYMERIQTDFTNSEFRTSIRFGGFFGRREPKFEEDNIIYSNYVSEQISMTQTNEYTMQSNLLPSCITQPIIDLMLFANDIYINDYNLNNHLREFIKFPVKFAENKGTAYFSTTTKAQLNLTFSEKIVNNIKRNY